MTYARTGVRMPPAGNPAPLAVAQDAAAGADDIRIGPGWEGGFTRDFATADGQRVIVVALTKQQFADLAKTTGLASTFAFLERVVSADFSTCADLHAHRGVIAALLAPWFSRRTVADVAAAFARTSVPWGLNLPVYPIAHRDGMRKRRPASSCES